jgi:hypothetical protein
MIDDDEEYSGPEAIIEEFPIDPVAARCESFTRLVSLAVTITDEELRKETLMMLGAVRRSFKTLPTGDITSIPGGKS